MKHLLVVIALCCFAIPANAEIVVRIVDFPAQVPQYSPVFVTASVENTGKEPVLIPANEDSGCHFEIGHSVGQISTFFPYSSTGGRQSIWLRPGEVFYYRQNLNRELQFLGRHYIRALLTSTGRCGYSPSSPDDLPVVQISEDHIFRVVQCWAGTVRSEIEEIEVVEPNGPTDREALEYIKSEEFPVKYYLGNYLQYRIIYGSSRLLARFPASHYAFVGIMHTSMDSPKEIEKALKLQPDHPMAIYMRLGLALALIKENREAEVTPEFIAKLKLKPAHEAYLAQVMREKRLKEQMESKAPDSKK